MKACVLHAVGDFRYEEAATPTPDPDDVIVRVRTCGVCGSDVLRVFKKGTYYFPMIPGHELAGEVVRTGSSVNAAWVGKPVTVFPLIPCRGCAACRIGAFAHCEDYSYLGSRCDGGFAQFVRAPDWNLVPIPEGVSFEEAAMVEPAAVAAHALRQAGVDLGDTVLVLGAGPVGLMVARWAQVWGAGKVLVADIDGRKLEFARSLGFTAAFNPQDGDVAEWVRSLTKDGADVTVEASGSSAAVEQCMLNTRMFGKVVLMGNPEGEIKLSQNGYWAILRRELRLFGTWNSLYKTLPRDEWNLVLEFIASGRLDLKPLITHRVTLEQLPGALVMMRDRTEFFNKVMYASA